MPRHATLAPSQGRGAQYVTRQVTLHAREGALENPRGSVKEVVPAIPFPSCLQRVPYEAIVTRLGIRTFVGHPEGSLGWNGSSICQQCGAGQRDESVACLLLRGVRLEKELCNPHMPRGGNERGASLSQPPPPLSAVQPTHLGPSKGAEGVETFCRWQREGEAMHMSGGCGRRNTRDVMAVCAQLIGDRSQIGGLRCCIGREMRWEIG